MPSRHYYKTYSIVLLLLAIMSVSNTADANSKITSPATTPATLTAGTITIAYSFQFRGNGGSTWSVTAGSLPPGLTLSSSGLLSGTPTFIGTYTFTVQFLANGGTSDTCACTLTIGGPGCSFVSGISNGALSFGTIDPSGSGTIYGTATQQVSFTCSLGLAYSISVSPASGWTIASGSYSIPYTLGVAPGGTYGGTAVDLLPANASSINVSNFINNPAGLYANTGAISITVSWAGGQIIASLPIGGVSGNVMDTCTTPVNGSITFTIDPSTAGPITPTTIANGTSPTVKCTAGQSHGVSCTSSHAYNLTIGNDGSTDPIAYTITGCPISVTGQGFLTSVPINFGLSLSATGPNGYQDAAAGAHSDTITVQVSY